MRRFTTTCIDNLTGAVMVLYDCSFNAACMFLERENKDNRFGSYKETECLSRYVSKIVFERATFLYDEERGCLMRKS